MKVKVLFFGIIADSTGLQMKEISDIKNLDGLQKSLSGEFPDLLKYMYRFAVNQQLVSGNKSLKDGDEIALLPPFGGG